MKTTITLNKFHRFNDWDFDMTKKKKTLEEQKAELQEKYDAKIAKIDAMTFKS